MAQYNIDSSWHHQHLRARSNQPLLYTRASTFQPAAGAIAQLLKQKETRVCIVHTFSLIVYSTPTGFSPKFERSYAPFFTLNAQLTISANMSSSICALLLFTYSVCSAMPLGSALVTEVVGTVRAVWRFAGTLRQIE